MNANVPMAELSQDPHARARKMQSAILQRLGIQGTQARIAAALQVDESTVSRWKQDLERTCLILALLDLKTVEQTRVCVPPGEIAFLRATYNRIAQDAPWMLNEGQGE